MDWPSDLWATELLEELWGHGLVTAASRWAWVAVVSVAAIGAIEHAAQPSVLVVGHVASQSNGASCQVLIVHVGTPFH